MARVELVGKLKGLTFGEALEAMKAGKRVRKSTDSKNFYYYRDGFVVRDNLKCLWSPTFAQIEGTDWEIVGDEKEHGVWKRASEKDYTEVHDIGWAVKQMWDGRAVRKKQWEDKTCRLVMERGYNQIHLCRAYFPTDRSFKLTPVELLSTDWELYEELPQGLPLPISPSEFVGCQQTAVGSKTKGLTFSEALEAMKAGKKVRMHSWESSIYYFFDGCKIRLADKEIYNQAMHDIPTYEVLSTDWEIVE